MARFVGVGFVAYFAVAIPEIGQPPGLVASWFPPVAVFLVLGPAIALIVTTFVPTGTRYLPLLLILCAVGYVAACLLWFAAWTGIESASVRVTWLVNFGGLPSMAIALLWLRPAIAMLAVGAFLPTWITVTGRIDGISENAVVLESLWTILFTAPIMVACRMLVRTGGILDETRSGAMQAAADSAAAAARNSERSRFDALIHDRVIATLVAAKGQRDDPRLPGQAQQALEELSRIADGHDEKAQLSAAETVARLRAVASSVDVDVPIGLVPTDGLDHAVPRYPEAAVRAVSEALGEALRNSSMHAGADAERVVLVDLFADAFEVSVADNGVGFDVAAVPPERLGIVVSIRARLA
ncbi:MAG: ATP-binding protein, partial [Gordonia sp. (in: high G+C Gram-positive bacteria)]|uniref:ATP-binding protein n=1 Tax=Gordonia sp. (in: high G+C Gram-positive bacteria) TaxID=84139 RepID=UPI003BB7AA11